MKNKKRLLAVVTTLTMAIACVPAFAADASSFKDVDTAAYYCEDVSFVVEKGYMSGASEDTFAPEAAVSGKTAVEVIYRLAGQAKADKGAVEWAAANGIVDEAFDSDADVTREQLAVLLCRYAKLAGCDVASDTDLSVFADADKVYAVAAMKWACGNGIICGSDGMLLPGATATRAQLAAVVHRFAELLSKPVVKEVTVASTSREGAQIPAYITLPADYTEGTVYPLVVLCHGHGGNHSEWGGFDKITNGLAEKGMIAVTMDYPGCGASTESFQLNTLTNMKADTLDVISYMLDTYKLDKDNVGIFGYSMGGRIALELIAEGKFNFAAVELVAPAEDTQDLKNLVGGAEAWETMKAEANEKGFTVFTTIYGQVQELSAAWFADIESYDGDIAEKAAANYKGDSLVIYATNDEAVSPSVSAAVAEIMGSEVLNTYADGHSYSFYGSDPHTISTTNDGSINFFTKELVK